MATMIKMNTADLTGAALDFAVGLAQGWIRYESDSIEAGRYWHTQPERAPYDRTIYLDQWRPCTDWNQAGPLIHAHQIEFSIDEDRGAVHASLLCWRSFGKSHRTRWSKGENHLIAACRAIVSAHLGDEVEVPVDPLRLHVEED